MTVDKKASLLNLLNQLQAATKQSFISPARQARYMSITLKGVERKIRRFNLNVGELRETLALFRGEYSNREFLSKVIGKDIVSDHTTDLQNFITTLIDCDLDWDKVKEASQ